MSNGISPPRRTVSAKRNSGPGWVAGGRASIDMVARLGPSCERLMTAMSTCHGLTGLLPGAAGPQMALSIASDRR